MKAYRLCLSALLFSDIVYADPACLDCVLNGSEIKKFRIMFDESEGNITHTWEGGGAFNAKGFFAANSISYQNIIVSSVTATFAYEINRTTLGMVQTFSVKATDPKIAAQMPVGSPSTSTGNCNIASTTGRKI